MIYLIIALVVWLVGTVVAYNKYIKKWDKKQYEKIYFSLMWPFTLLLYGIHYAHNNL